MTAPQSLREALEKAIPCIRGFAYTLRSQLQEECNPEAYSLVHAIEAIADDCAAALSAPEAPGEFMVTTGDGFNQLRDSLRERSGPPGGSTPGEGYWSDPKTYEEAPLTPTGVARIQQLETVLREALRDWVPVPDERDKPDGELWQFRRRADALLAGSKP